MTEKNENAQFDEDDEIIDLTNAAIESPESDEASETPEVSILGDEEDIETFGGDFEDDMGLPPEEEDDFVESLGMEVEPVITEEDTVPDFQDDKAGETEAAGPLSVTPEQVEAALERVVKNLYAEKIENILVDVVKKTITKEIDRLKATLLEDLKGDQ